MKRIIRRLREAVPKADREIKLRADNGFTDADLYQRRDEWDVQWTLNDASNAGLKRRTEDVLREVQTVYEETEQKTTRYVLLEGYQAGSGEDSRPVGVKIEGGRGRIGDLWCARSPRSIRWKRLFSTRAEACANHPSRS